VYRRSLVLVAALVALLFVPAALAARVHVRVEGKTQTIFGATEPTLDVKANVLDAVEAASIAGEVYYHVRSTSFGPYVDQIGRYAESSSAGWVFKVNGILSPVGASAVQLRDGDTVLFYYANFSGPAGPLTLEVEVAKPKCPRRATVCQRTTLFYATGRNDAGRSQRVSDVVFTINGRRVASKNGIGRTTARRWTVRVSKPGAVRSRVYSS
jgi:Domain of unknown function (DUF4430)